MKTLKGKIAISIFVGVILLNIGSVLFAPDSNSNASPTRNTATTPPQTQQVTYKVTTSRDSSVWPSCYGFDVTYEMSGGTAQKRANICDGAKSVEVDVFTGSRGDFVYLSVQNDEYLARIACEIYLDGKLAFRTQSEGQYVIASCSGSIP